MKKRIAFVLVVVMLMLSGCSRAEDYIAGVYTSNGYASSFMDYRFNAPDGCKLYNLEQLAQLMGIDVAAFGGDQSALRLEMAKKQEIIEMYAYMPSNANAIVGIAITSTKGFTYDNMVKSLGELLPSYRGLSISEKYEIVEFMGRECAKLDVRMTMNGVEARQDLYLFYDESYVGFVGISYTEEMIADRDALYNAFSAQ